MHPPGADGVLFAPYLSGERTPHADPDIRAAFVGLALTVGSGYDRTNTTFNFSPDGLLQSVASFLFQQACACDMELVSIQVDGGIPWSSQTLRQICGLAPLSTGRSSTTLAR